MSAPHPTRIVRLQLIGTLLGVSIPFAVEALVQKHSTPMILATAGFVFTSLNFFHGKVVTLEDDDYNHALTDRPKLALADYILNVAVALSFVFMAFNLDVPTGLIIANLVVRTLDIPVVLLAMNVASDPEVLKANKFWLIFDISTIVVFLIVAYLFYGTGDYQIVVSATFLGIILLDITLDYTINRRFFFSMADSWDDMAQFWDAMQGERGDIFRRAVIIPEITRELGELRDKRVVDLGCGNGCIARALVAANAQVTALDKSEAHLNIARTYNGAGIEYRVADLDGPTEQFEREVFDAAVAVFTLQDCKDLQQPMRVIARMLKPGARLVIIRDNDQAFENLGEHSTTRRWLGAEKNNGRGRRQLVFWTPQAIRIGRGGALGSEADEIASEWTNGYRTITRYWNNASYTEAAQLVGLELVSSNDSLEVDAEARVPETLHLRRYQKRPRLGSIVFRKPAPQKQPAQPALPSRIKS